MGLGQLTGKEGGGWRGSLCEKASGWRPPTRNAQSLLCCKFDCAPLQVAGTSVELRNIKIFHREHPNLNMRHEGMVEPSWPMFESTLFRLELQKCRWSGSRPRFCDIRCTGLGLPLTDGLIARRWPAIARPNPARRGILGVFLPTSSPRMVGRHGTIANHLFLLSSTIQRDNSKTAMVISNKTVKV